MNKFSNFFKITNALHCGDEKLVFLYFGPMIA